MNDTGNHIQSLGTWDTDGASNCLYSTATGCNITISVDVDPCNTTKSLVSDNIYYLCSNGQTIMERLQALSSVIPSDDAVAIYVKSLSCMFGLYDHTDADAIAASNGWSIMYYADFQSNSIYKNYS